MNLACPKCGAVEDMHQSQVEVYERIAPGGEDGDGVRVTVKGAHSVITEALPEDDMPGRRNAIRISFNCWHCNHNSQLQIQQHKGPTYFEWLGPDHGKEVEIK